MKEYYVIGLMSGTSLDGLDVAYCKFANNDNNKDWYFELISIETYPYQAHFKERLRDSIHLDQHSLSQLSWDFGQFMAEKLKSFIEAFDVDKIDLVASHGHTVFHEPQKGLTLQIGDAQPLYNLLKKPVVYDFRSQDVALGGQGAPLVPIVDKLLFSQYDACINLGGFSNISFDINSERIAFDICPVNIVLNLLAQQLGQDYDNKGLIAKSGILNHELLVKLNGLDYYAQSHPKSLAWEWLRDNMLPIIEESTLPVPDIMRTFATHIVNQITIVLNRSEVRSVLLTGGGAYNDFLVDLLVKESGVNIITGEDELIEGKEAMAFALLGLLKYLNQVNVLASVTGSVKDHSSGVIFQG